MIRLHVFAEGQTEQTFGDTVLQKHLAAFNICMNRPRLFETSPGYGGGVLDYSKTKRQILNLLKQETVSDVFFTTMIDLYSLPNDFPGTSETEKLRHSPYDRVAKLEECFATDIVDPHGRPSRFIPHIQLHEFETILFCRPQAFYTFFENCSKEIESLEQIVKTCKEPELINDGNETAPSKRIEQLFPRYDKLSDGPQIAAEIGLGNIRGLCPHFDAWLKKLESLHHG